MRKLRFPPPPLFYPAGCASFEEFLFADDFSGMALFFFPPPLSSFDIVNRRYKSSGFLSFHNNHAVYKA